MEWSAEGILLRGSYARGRQANANAVCLTSPASDIVRTACLGVEYARGSGNWSAMQAAGEGFKPCPRAANAKSRQHLHRTSRASPPYGIPTRQSDGHRVLAGSRRGWSLTPAFALFRATEDVYQGRGVVRDWSRGTATSERTTRDVGWEADFNATFPIIERLNGYLDIGYFQPGRAYALASGARAPDAHEVVLGMELKF